MHRFGRSVSLATMVLMALPGSALANRVMHESEPNNERATANGPLLSGDTWYGAAGTSNDVDVYVMYVGPGQTELHITLTNTGGDTTGEEQCILLGGDLGWRLGNSEGNVIMEEEEYNGVAPHKTGALNYTVEGPATYYYAVDADSCALDHGAGSSYYFTVESDPALLNAPYTAPPAPPPPAPPPAAPLPPAPKPVTCRVPALYGLTRHTAESRLARDHCKLGKVHVLHRHAARVARQSMAPGSVLPDGARVNVTMR